MNEQKKFLEVSIDEIIPNRFQPREYFDEAELNILSQSIKEHGIIQPLVLRKIGNKYEIVAGERRFKAAAMAGLNRVPAIILDLTDAQSAEMALIENVQRQDLSSIEEARTYQKILDMGHLTQEQLANRVGKAQSTVANKLRLLNLDEEVQDALLKGKISERHARSLLNLESKEEQRSLLHQIINQRLSVRDTDLKIKEITKPKTMLAPELEIISDEEDGKEGQKVITENNNQSSFGSIEPNINKILEQATDINPEEKLAPMDDFLTPNKEREIQEEKPRGRFFMPFDDIEEERINFEEPLENRLIGSTAVPKKDEIEMPKETYSSYAGSQLEKEPIMEEARTIAAHNVRDAVNEIRKTVDNIQKAGIDVNTEEFDFERMYQIIVKIYK